MMATAHLVAAGRPVRFRYALGWYAGRGLWIAIWAAVVLSALTIVALIALVASSYRPAVVNTSSMDPTLGTGDVIVSEVVAASAVAVGDIVTYEDSMRGGAVITERVVAVQQVDSMYAFTTQGDASSSQEHWSIDGESSVGRVAYRVPGLGSVLALATAPLARGAMLLGLAVLIIGPVARRVRSELRD